MKIKSELRNENINERPKNDIENEFICEPSKHFVKENR